jgi:hypothetical protein
MEHPLAKMKWFVSGLDVRDAAQSDGVKARKRIDCYKDWGLYIGIMRRADELRDDQFHVRDVLFVEPTVEKFAAECSTPC